MDAQAKKKALFRARLNAQKQEKQRIDSPLVRYCIWLIFEYEFYKVILVSEYLLIRERIIVINSWNLYTTSKLFLVLIVQFLKI